MVASANIDTQATDGSYIPRYHESKESVYALPNDSLEHVRLDHQAFHLSQLMSNGILHNPLVITAATSASPKRILDVGCGTGVVTDLLARTFPSASVFGLDLSPVPKNLHKRPRNVKFAQGNILDGIETLVRLTAEINNDAIQPTNKDEETKDTCANGVPPSPTLEQDRSGQGLISAQFDLIFSRLLVLGMSDWPSYLATACTALNPGGYLEVHEFDFTWYTYDGNCVSDGWEWSRRQAVEMKKRNLEVRCGRKLGGWLSVAGFDDVQTYEYKWPFVLPNNETTIEQLDHHDQPRPELQDIAAWTSSTSGLPAALHHWLTRLVNESEEAGAVRDQEIKKLQQEIWDTVGNPARWRENGLYGRIFVAVGRKAV